MLRIRKETLIENKSENEKRGNGERKRHVHPAVYEETTEGFPRIKCMSNVRNREEKRSKQKQI